MNGFRKIFPSFLSHYATFFAERKVVPFDEFYYHLKLTHLFQKHPVYPNSKCDLLRRDDMNAKLRLKIEIEKES
jgi:hypothetical protein